MTTMTIAADAKPRLPRGARLRETAKRLGFGIELQMAGQIRHDKKQIAEFLGHMLGEHAISGQAQVHHLAAGHSND